MTDISETLRAQAELVEAEPEGDYVYTKPLPARHPAQVYSLRLPPDRLEELRNIAARQGIPAGTLMRQWVLERLDAEGKLSPEATSFHKAIVLAVTEALKSLKLNTQDDKEEAQRRQNEVIISQLLPSLQMLVEDINEMESAPAPDPLIRNLGERGTRILDLMEALKASVESTRAQEEPSEESRESA